MAQLTDDCFAFAGPLLRIDEMERLIAERVVAGCGMRGRRAAARAQPRACADVVVAGQSAAVR